MGANPDRSIEIQELARPQGELHLRFFASGQEFALSALGIREVISAPPDRITPIPNVSPLLLGTLNLRGRVIWVTDLGQLLGQQQALNTERGEIPVIAIEDQDTILGLAVEYIVGMGWLDIATMQSAQNVTAAIAPFVQGECLLDAKTNQYIRILNQAAILRSGQWTA